jgi:hypothetical protein
VLHDDWLGASEDDAMKNDELSNTNESYESHAAHEARGDNTDASQLDVLLSRAVAGDTSALRAVCERGAVEPAVLREFALWQADELRLMRAARALDACADTIEAPSPSPSSRVREGLGWAVAAVLTVLFIGRAYLPSDARTSTPNASVAGFGGFASSDEAFDAYVAKAREEGVVTGDVAPPTLLRSRELGSGRGFEVVFVRQIIERRVSPEIYRVAPSGETGQLRQILIRPRTDLMQ